MGKQQVAQLTFFDYVVAISIGSIAAELSVNLDGKTIDTLTGMAVWTVLAISVAVIQVKSMKIRKLLQGDATLVIDKGKISEENLKKLRLTADELLSELRANNIFNVADVEYALFEPSGKLSISKKPHKQNVTAEDMNIQKKYSKLPVEVIIDGKLLQENLKKYNISKAWIYHQLSKEKIYDTGKIFLGQIDSEGNLYIDMKEEDKYYIILS